MKILVKIVLVALALQGVLLGVGCRKSEEKAKAVDAGVKAREARAEPARVGQHLRVQVDYLPRFLNPLVTHDRVCWRLMMHNVFETLVRPNQDGGVRGHLAAEVKTLRGGRGFSFTLRPGVTFHDGRPLTSADVEYTLELLRGKRSPHHGLRRELAQIRDVRTPKPNIVEIHLRRTNNLFLSLLADVPIMPAHIYARRGIRNGNVNRQPVGSGPFIVAAREKKTRLTFERNEEYWGMHARLDTVEFRAISDPALALAALRNGELDLLQNLYHGYYPEQVEQPRLKQRYRVLRIHPYRMRLMLFNSRRAPLKDRRVRKALIHLTDRQSLVRTIRNDLGQVLSGPFWTLGLWYNRPIHPRTFDRSAAAKLLDGAGWRRRGADKVRVRQGWPLKLSLLVARNSPEMRKAATALKKEYAAAGVDLAVEVGDYAYMKLRLRRGKFDLALLGLGLRQEPDLYPYLHSKGELNYGGYESTAVDAALQSLRAAELAESRLPVARRVHRLLHDDPPLCVLYAPIELMVVDRRLRGLANNGRWPKLVTLSFADE